MSDPSAQAHRDFLVHAVTNRTGSAVAEQIRDKGAEVVLSIYRLVKTALVHAIENQAVAAAVHATAGTLRSFSAAVGGPVSVTFIDDTVFICGQLLRASRGTYESAIELGALLARAGASEVTFAADVTNEALTAFAAELATAVRDQTRQGGLLAARFVGITVRKTDPALDRDSDEGHKRPAEKVVRLYASALAVMRRFFDGVAAGSTLLPHRVKRLSQSLSAIAEVGHPAMLGMTALAHAHRDDAGRAVQSALLAVVIARQITRDRVDLSRLAMAALLAEAGRVRVAGITGRDRLVPLPDSLDAEVPGATSATCLAMAGVNLPNAQRTVITHEATWLERAELLGPPYQQSMSTLLQAQILHMIRAILDRIAPRDASRPMSPLDALAEVARMKSVDPALLRLAVRAIGVIPTGTVLELETGEWAVVIARSANPAALHRPRVRIVTDPSGRALDAPVELDLGTTPERGSTIARILDPGAAAFNVMRTFLAS